jgi:hypothetical protein
MVHFPGKYRRKYHNGLTTKKQLSKEIKASKKKLSVDSLNPDIIVWYSWQRPPPLKPISE